MPSLLGNVPKPLTMERLMRRRFAVAALMLAAYAAPVPALAQSQAAVSPATAEIQRAAMDSYIYLYPLIAMDLARRQAVSPKNNGQPGRAPANSFWFQRQLNDPQGGAWPHPDMLRMSAWLDLSEGPVVISVPQTQGRLFTLTLHDLWSDAFAMLGKRTLGSNRGNYVVVPPGWTAALPPAMQRIDAPTSQVWVQGLLKVGNGADAQVLQDGFIATPLQDWNRGAQSMQVKSDPNLDLSTPVAEQIAKMPADVFFSYGADLLRKNPPHTGDQPVLTRLRRAGIAPGQQLAFSKLDNTTQQALRRAAREGNAYLESAAAVPRPAVRGWVAEREAIGAYGSAYLKRALMARSQPGAELPEDVLTLHLAGDANGLPLAPDARYVLRFEADELPPGEGFWTLAAYDARGQPLDNRYRRYSVSDLDPLRYNPDGSLEIYLQADPPADADRANWLPLSGSSIQVLMRVYQPAAEALDGRWNPPEVNIEVQPAADEPAAESGSEPAPQ